MIESIEVTNYRGESITLPLRSPEQSGFFVGGIDGLGPVKGTINLTESPNVDGGFYNSSRKTFRNIVIFLGMYDSVDSVENLRHITYEYFPVKTNVVIKVTTDSQVLYTEGYVESNDINIFSRRQLAQISIVCPDANMKELGPTTEIFSGVNPLFEFPFENTSTTVSTLEMGEYLLTQQKNLLYEGDVPIGIIVESTIGGTVEDLRIYNLTLQQQIHLDDTRLSDILGSSLASGDKVIVSTVIGDKFAKVIRSDVEYNVFNAINFAATGHAWVQIQPGDNVMYVTADVGEQYIQTEITYHPAYEGV